MNTWDGDKHWRVGYKTWNIYTDYGYDNYITHLDIDNKTLPECPSYIDCDLFALCVMSDELIELLTHIKDRDEFPVSQLARDFLNQWDKLTNEVKEAVIKAHENYKKHKDDSEYRKVMKDLEPKDDMELLKEAFDKLGDDDEDQSKET